MAFVVDYCLTKEIKVKILATFYSSSFQKQKDRNTYSDFLRLFRVKNFYGTLKQKDGRTDGQGA